MFGIIILILVSIITYIIYKKYNKSIKSSTNIIEHDHCIIIGGSIGGMITAAYLTKYFKKITIIESDDVLNDTLIKSTPDEILNYRCQLESPTSIGRSGVPQIYQLHVMLGEGQKILREIFPNFEKDLLDEYNTQSYSLNNGQLTVNGIVLYPHLIDDITWLGIDRFSLELFIRKQFISKFQDKIQWKCNTRVKDLIVDKSLNIVKGVKYRSKDNNNDDDDNNNSSLLNELYGDFIIDCSGRNSSSTKWLEHSLDLIVPKEEMHFGSGYLTFIGERLKTGNSKLDSLSIFCTSVDSPLKNKGFFITPIRKIKATDDNSLGTLSTIGIHCANNEYPPNDSFENLLEWVKDNLDSNIYSILKSTKVHSPLIPYRRAYDSRKYVESLGTKWPENFIILGDAMCTFNPQFGQGMTQACRHAKALDDIFKENWNKLKNISRIFNRHASKISEECWIPSTASDWNTPTLKIIKIDKNGKKTVEQRDENSILNNESQLKPSLMIRYLQWYTYWFLRCASKSEKLTTDFHHVTNQLKDPSLLMKPTTILLVFYTAFINFFHLTKK